MLRHARAILKRTPRNSPGGSSRPSFALLAWWSFFIALVTGALLSFHYRPWGDVFKTVSRMTGLLPYGKYLRTLHYLSGQSFLIFCLIHALHCFWRARYRFAPPTEWVRLISLLVLAFVLLLTGFILKGDKEGILAANVLYHLVQEIPLIGSSLAGVLIRPGEDLFLLPFIHHAIILPFTVLFLLARHRRSLFPKGNLGWPFLAILCLLALIYPIPPDIPPHMDWGSPSGPWFFQGIQLLLRYVPPFWAGVVWPLLPLCLMAVLPFVPLAYVRWARTATALSWCAHGALLLVAWWLVPEPSQ